MPRDRNGVPFGVDSVVRVCKKGPDNGNVITVRGFIVQNKRVNIKKLQEAIDPSGRLCFYRWLDVENTDPLGDGYSARHLAHVDTCAVDVLQVEQGAKATLKKQQSRAANEADKVVWGT